MNFLMIKDNEYKKWLEELSKLYKSSQIKAAISVNKEMLIFYWTLGKDIVKLKAESKWGSGFYENLSLDLQKIIPNTKGFSVTNLKYMNIAIFLISLGGTIDILWINVKIMWKKQYFL